MNVIILYGSCDSTLYDYTHFLLDSLHKNLSINLTEYFLYEDILYKQFINKSCTKYNIFTINKIARSISDSDLIIFACSNFDKQLLTPQLKLLLKQLNTIWKSNKINIPMNEKIAVVISDNYIPFFPSTYKTLKKSLKSWGIKNILNFCFKPYDNSSKIDIIRRKNYLNLVFLSLKILNLIYTCNDFSSIRSHNIIKFPYSKLVKNKINEKNNDSENKVIPIKNI